MQPSLAGCGRYPDDNASALLHKIAQLHGVHPEEVLVTGGLTDFLGMIGRAFLADGLNAITSERSFMVYRLATQAANAQLIEVPMRDNTFDLEAIAQAANRNSRVVFLANPNNPTGTIVGIDEVSHFLDGIPEDVIVVLDEAYYEFAADFAAMRGASYSNSLDYVREGRNVIVLRTFSKVHGLAGLRVGYGIAPAKLIQGISRQRSMYCVSTLAQAAASAALDDKAHIRTAVENNTAQAELLIPALSELGYAVSATWANFLYCELGRDASSFVDSLYGLGVAVRGLEQWGAPQAIRITIGTPTECRSAERAKQAEESLARSYAL